MSIVKYFNHGFQRDIGKLQFVEVPQVLKDILNDQDLIQFGGKNWSRAQVDLENIDVAVRPMFVLCLFALVATDQCMQTYFKPHYGGWRAQTAYPKFGWTRFGLYNENPLKLLSVPELEGLVDSEQTCALMREFVGFYRTLVADYCHLHAPQLSADLFFSRLLQDDIFTLCEGRAVAAFKHAAPSLIQARALDASPPEGYLLAV
ncbi:MAG: hypothetical protein NWS97_11100 [Limnohabitans sp.]|nr:hypothetical protein [Limnohabitans sp.]